MESKDIRVQKTIKNIEDTFLHLLKEKSFVNITIKYICDEAMIRRSTPTIRINMTYWNISLIS